MSLIIIIHQLTFNIQLHSSIHHQFINYMALISVLADFGLAFKIRYRIVEIHYLSLTDGVQHIVDDQNQQNARIR